MYDDYKDYNVLNSNIFIRTCGLYCHSEASVHGHEILKIKKNIKKKWTELIESNISLKTGRIKCNKLRKIIRNRILSGNFIESKHN